MKNNIILLLTFSLFLLSSCSKDGSSPSKEVDFRPNIVGEFSTWSITNYDKNGEMTGTDNGSAMIEIKDNASNSSGVNLFIDGDFELALMDGEEISAAYVFNYLTNGEKEGHKAITLDGTDYEAVYYKGSNKLEVYVVYFSGGSVSKYSKTVYGGKK